MWAETRKSSIRPPLQCEEEGQEAGVHVSGELSREQRGGDPHCQTGLVTVLQINSTVQEQVS